MRVRPTSPSRERPPVRPNHEWGARHNRDEHTRICEECESTKARDNHAFYRHDGYYGDMFAICSLPCYQAYASRVSDDPCDRPPRRDHEWDMRHHRRPQVAQPRNRGPAHETYDRRLERTDDTARRDGPQPRRRWAEEEPSDEEPRAKAARRRRRHRRGSDPRTPEADARRAERRNQLQGIDPRLLQGAMPIESSDDSDGDSPGEPGNPPQVPQAEVLLPRQPSGTPPAHLYETRQAVSKASAHAIWKEKSREEQIQIRELAKTRLPYGELSVMIDIGSVHNVIGSNTLHAFVQKAVQHNQRENYIPRASRLNIQGVGPESAYCEKEVVMPLAIPGVVSDPSGGSSVKEFYRANVAEGCGANLPAVIGKETLQDKDAVILLRRGEEVIAFPGPGRYLIEWSKGTRLFPLKPTRSGHLVMPCGEYEGLPQEGDRAAASSSQTIEIPMNMTLVTDHINRDDTQKGIASTI